MKGMIIPSQKMPMGSAEQSFVVSQWSNMDELATILYLMNRMS